MAFTRRRALLAGLALGLARFFPAEVCVDLACEDDGGSWIISEVHEVGGIGGCLGYGRLTIIRGGPDYHSFVVPFP